MVAVVRNHASCTPLQQGEPLWTRGERQTGEEARFPVEVRALHLHEEPHAVRLRRLQEGEGGGRNVVWDEGNLAPSRPSSHPLAARPRVLL